MKKEGKTFNETHSMNRKRFRHRSHFYGVRSPCATKMKSQPDLISAQTCLDSSGIDVESPNEQR